MNTPDANRRKLVLTGAAVLGAAGSLLAPVPPFAPALKAAEGNSDKEQVTPPEDLMREHGVLDRILLIYEAAMARFASREDFDPAVITDAARIVREFIEDYHEQSEETQVFPRFRKAGKLVDLIDVLLQQHRAGRTVTAKILQLAPASRSEEGQRQQLIAAMQAFIRMYRPHAAREDTDLFPMLQGLVSRHEYEAMAEDFEKQEHQKFGEDGFEKMRDRVAALEQKIGIHDLALFTPR